MRAFLRLLAGLFACAIFASATAAAPVQLQKGNVTSPPVQPGAIPDLLPGAGFAGPTATPTAQGNPADYGYADNAICDWDTPPQLDLNNTAADGPSNKQINVGVIAYHAPSNAEYASGLVNNITEVDASVDGGAWTPLYYGLNPDSNITEWVGRLTVGNFATDGEHEIRVKCIPSTGQPLVLQGPPVIYPRTGINITASFSGTTMTVSTASLGNGGTLQIGQSLMGANIPNGTYIAAFGTGNGSSSNTAGTYILNQDAGTISSESVSVAAAQSLFFNTNLNGSLRRMIVYVDDPSDPIHPGNDTNSGLTSSLPVADIKTCKNVINGTSGFGGSGVGGGVCCLEGSHAYLLEDANSPDTGRGTDTRWWHVQPTADAPCDGVNPGTAQLATTSPSAFINVSMVHLKDLTIDASNQGIYHNGTIGFFLGHGGAAGFWFDHVTFQGPGMDSHFGAAGSPGWAGGIFTTESYFSGFHDGPAAILNRNITVDHIVSDGLSRAQTTVNATDTYNNEYYGHGNVHNGSTTVDGLDFDATKYLTPGGAIGLTPGVSGIPTGTTIAAINGPSSITISAAATADVTGAHLEAQGEHPDLYQAGGTGQVANIIVWNADAGSSTNYAEGVLWDSATFGAVIYGSKWGPNPDFYVFQTTVLDHNFNMVNTDFGNGGLGILFRTASGNVNEDVSVINDTCTITPITVPSGVKARGGSCFVPN